jgi:hypothetical protein
MGMQWVVFDSDGTREAARQRALPKDPELPTPARRLRPVCAPGYTGRKRGEVLRTRTIVLQAHLHQWLATFGNSGNGQYREELRRAVAAIRADTKAYKLSEEQALLRLDGQYGTGAVLSEEGLESKMPSTSLHAPVAPSAGGYSGGSGLLASIDLDAANTFSDAAGAFSALVDRASETECVSSN